MTRRAISRRALLGSGGAVVAVGAAGVVGDRTGALGSAARSLGIDPRHRPAVVDQAVLAAARQGQSRLLAQTRTVTSAHSATRTVLAPLASRISSQLAHLGGPDGSSSPTIASGQSAALKQLAAACTTSGTARAADAASAVSGELAQVLASIAVSLSQDAVIIDALRQELA